MAAVMGGFNETRANRVDANSVAEKLHGHHLGEHYHPGLRDAVLRSAGEGDARAAEEARLTSTPPSPRSTMWRATAQVSITPVKFTSMTFCHPARGC